MTEVAGTRALSISLRPFEIEDADDVMVWKGDPRVAEFSRWDAYTSCDEAVAFIRDFAISHEWCRAICVAGRPVGCICITIGEGADRCCGRLKYEVAHGYWGKGVASSAVRLAVPAVFREFPGLERIQAMVILENRGSIRVLEKCGFLREGILKRYVVVKGRVWDLAMFSILSEEIQPCMANLTSTFRI
ncbi:uncharacterized protein LOC116262426 [Nymphaea colorata]|uniref:N-acetyltransferase domain-containing protein n=1 Tax=Nymphaea colorata TaxID=210225 RepID=A0A5K0VH96_9MAGN|nr:uncharacterized protein LOC116262426 [Nymphaea colorata]